MVFVDGRRVVAWRGPLATRRIAIPKGMLVALQTGSLYILRLCFSIGLDARRRLLAAHFKHAALVLPPQESRKDIDCCYGT